MRVFWYFHRSFRYFNRRWSYVEDCSMFSVWSHVFCCFVGLLSQTFIPHLCILMTDFGNLIYPLFGPPNSLKNSRPLTRNSWEGVWKRNAFSESQPKSRLQRIYWTPRDYEYNLSTRKILVALSLIKDPYKSISH